MSQLSLFRHVPTDPTPRRPPDLDWVRKRLKAKLWLMRTAETLPWSEPETATQERHFPELARYLPDDEAEALIAEFEGELARLRSAA